MEEITDVQPSLVMLIVDMHPVLWSLRQQYGTQEFLKLDDVAQICVIFLNTVKLMHRQNEVCVLFSHPDGSELIYPPATTKAASAHESLPNVVTQAFRVRIDNMLASPSDASAAQNTPDPYGLSQALSRALCGSHICVYVYIYFYIICDNLPVTRIDQPISHQSKDVRQPSTTEPYLYRAADERPLVFI